MLQPLDLEQTWIEQRLFKPFFSKYQYLVLTVKNLTYYVKNSTRKHKKNQTLSQPDLTNQQ